MTDDVPLPPIKLTVDHDEELAKRAAEAARALVTARVDAEKTGDLSLFNDEMSRHVADGMLAGLTGVDAELLAVLLERVRWAAALVSALANLTNITLGAVKTVLDEARPESEEGTEVPVERILQAVFLEAEERGSTL